MLIDKEQTMNKLTYEEKSKLLFDETVDLLRNKSHLSTFLERAVLTAEAGERFANFPQPHRAGYGLDYVLERASCPVEPHDILLGRFPETVPDGAEEAQFNAALEKLNRYGHYAHDNGHTPLDWGEIVKIGLGGYVKRCESELERRRKEGDEARITFLEGALISYKAISKYILRYAYAAEEAGHADGAALCRAVATEPPRTFAEALQLVLMINNVYSVYCVGCNATLCCGRMDDYLLPFYLDDIESGKLTREEAGCLIDDFNCKCAIPLGRGEHQLEGDDGVVTGWTRNPVYDSPTYIIIGGYSNVCDHRENPLTLLFAERIRPRLENPVYVFRRTKETPPTIMRVILTKMRENASVLLYNDETMIPSFEFSGVERCDAVNYTIHGCNWPDIQGLNTYRVIHAPLAPIIMNSIFDEDVVPKRSYKSIDEVYRDIGERYRKKFRDGVAEYFKEKNDPAQKGTLRFSDCFKKGILEAAEWGYKASKYPFILNRILHIGTGADIMAALDDVVFGGKFTLTQLAEALRRNFEGHEDVLKACLDAPKYGHDDDRADSHAVRLMTLLTDIINEESFDAVTGERLVFSPTVTISDMFYRGEGKWLGATPDGRRAGAPFSENLSPTRGQSWAVTSLLKSVAKLPFDRISSGALNVRLSPSMIGGEDGLARMTALFETYFNMGGMQIQLSVTDAETLRKAKADPDSYRDLMVRITGYSAVFVDMGSDAQDEIIARDSLV